MTHENTPTDPQQADAREAWEQPVAAKFRAGDAETTGGFVNETGFS